MPPDNPNKLALKLWTLIEVSASGPWGKGAAVFLILVFLGGRVVQWG